MVESGFPLRVPSHCPACQRERTAQLHQVLDATTLFISWWCVECGAEWPIDELRYLERRSGIDRRRVTRGGRRKP